MGFVPASVDHHHPIYPLSATGLPSALLAIGAGPYAPVSPILSRSLQRSSRCITSCKLVESQELQQAGGEPSLKAVPFRPRAASHQLLQVPWETNKHDGHRPEKSANSHVYLPAPWQQGPHEIGRDVDEDCVRAGDFEAKALNDMSAMERIVAKLRTLQKAFAQPGKTTNLSSLLGQSAEMLSVPEQNQDIFSIGKNWSTPDHPVPEPGRGLLDDKFPWERNEKLEEEEAAEKERRVKPPTLAELTIPSHELERLREAAIKMQYNLKIGKLGVTDGIVGNIKEKWQTSELVRLKCEGPAVLNMKKIHQDLERKSGGLVVFRSGSIVVVYRGRDYDKETRVASSLTEKLEGLISPENRWKPIEQTTLYEPRFLEFENNRDVQAVMPHDGPHTGPHVGLEISPPEEEGDKGKSVRTDRDMESQIAQRLKTFNVQPDPLIDRENEAEVDSLLEGLGPRFDAWTGLKPIPVDADLLPSSVPNFRPPYRLLPYGVRPRLTDAEFTNLRRLARPLAPHFVLGRNRGNQGLAAAMVKLWEKSEIAKIAVKRGVQNTRNERMAEELKRLTGGILLARDKYFITFYRGKDFLPEQVATALSKQEAMVQTLQEEEERARADVSIAVERESGIQPSIAVNAKKAPSVKPSWVDTMDIGEQDKLKKEAARQKRLASARQMDWKLALAIRKKKRAERDLSDVEAFLKPIEKRADTESLTEEERFMYRKLGLKMDAFLLLGRRGVFDGVVENMHLHWKHRELVKIIVKERDPDRLQDTARMLESESGGILVAIVATSKGQAIVVYRGKNYRRPTELRPRNLLTKRKAYKRYQEMQRRTSLSQHIQGLEEEIVKMRARIKDTSQMEEATSNCLCEDETGAEVLQNSLEVIQRNSSEFGPAQVVTAASLEGQSISGKKMSNERMKNLMNLVRSGPIFRADPLTNIERLKLRKEALTSKKASQFNVGKSNMLAGLARAIRLYFLHHALAKVGVKGRGHGTSLQDLVHELEDLTGGVMVSQEPNTVILYRGWPEGDKLPAADGESLEEELSPELRAALEAEEDWDEHFKESHFFAGEEDGPSDFFDEEEEEGGLHDFPSFQDLNVC